MRKSVNDLASCAVGVDVELLLLLVLLVLDGRQGIVVVVGVVGAELEEEDEEPLLDPAPSCGSFVDLADNLGI